MVAENKLSDNLKNIVYKSSDINVSALMEVTNNILKKSKNENDLCNMLLKMKEHTESIYAHSINVSIFCQILARWTNCTEQEIEDVAVAHLHQLTLLLHYHFAYLSALPNSHIQPVNIQP